MQPRDEQYPRLNVAMSVALFRHTPLVVLVLAYCTWGVFRLGSLGRIPPLTVVGAYRGSLALLLLYLLTTLFGAILWHVVVKRRRPLALETWKHLTLRWFGPERIAGAAIVLALLPPLLGVMYELRLSLTLFEPFRWDTTFAHVESVLHFGRQPYVWLQPLFGRPAVTRVIDTIYVYGWFAALWLGVLWQTVHGREPVRSQFLLSFALSWMALGTFAAFYFSSAGPAFYAQVTGTEGPYKELMDYLGSLHSQSPLYAVDNQQRLSTSYTEWGGMTAMPSMHLTIMAVVTIATIRTYRWLSWIVLPLLCAILLGSVVLGWHYAIDGYAGILGALVIWFAVGRFLRWWSSLYPGLTETDARARSEV